MQNLLRDRGFFSALFIAVMALSSPNTHPQNQSSLKQPIEKPYIQEASRFAKSEDSYKNLSLTDAIEKGLRLNFRQKDRGYAKKVLNLEFRDSWEAFYLPQLNLSLTTTPQKIAHFQQGINDPTEYSKTPSGTLEFGFKDYSLFNWGKDYLRFLNTKANYRKASRNLKEKERALKHNIIIQYFELLYRQKTLEARRRQLRHASFVYRLNREKVSLRKVGKQEYYQSRAEYLKAQNDYHFAKTERELVNERMAYLISDPTGSRYILKSDLNYTRLKLTLKEALQLSREKNPNILDSKVELANTKRDYEVTLKENLPLPKFELKLGAYTHSFGERNNTSRSPIDLVASLNATWSLTGPGGLFNQRRTDKSLITKARAFNNLAHNKHLTYSSIQNHFTNIWHLEDQIKILEARTTTLDKSFDVVLENYLNRKTHFLHFQDTLIEMVNTDILLAQYHYLHTREKVLLAGKIGVDDYPGQNFESLAKERNSR